MVVLRLPGEPGEQAEDLRPAGLLSGHVPRPGAAEGVDGRGGDGLVGEDAQTCPSSGTGTFTMPLPSSVPDGWPGSFCAGLANDDGEYTIAPWNTRGK